MKLVRPSNELVLAQTRDGPICDRTCTRRTALPPKVRGSALHENTMIGATDGYEIRRALEPVVFVLTVDSGCCLNEALERIGALTGTSRASMLKVRGWTLLKLSVFWTAYRHGLGHPEPGRSHIIVAVVVSLVRPTHEVVKRRSASPCRALLATTTAFVVRRNLLEIAMPGTGDRNLGHRIHPDHAVITVIVSVNLAALVDEIRQAHHSYVDEETGGASPPVSISGRSCQTPPEITRPSNRPQGIRRRSCREFSRRSRG